MRQKIIKKTILLLILALFFLVSFKDQDINSSNSTLQNTKEYDFASFDRLEEVTINIQKSNPTWTDEQVKSELEKIITAKSYSGPMVSLNELKVICSKGLGAIFTVANLKHQAESKANQNYINTETLYQGDGDAFRHVYFSALLYKEFGKQFSIDLLTAHEENIEDLLDKEMDLHNNSRGISLYEMWLNKFNYVGLDTFIYHCVSYGYFYNIVEIKTDPTKFSYTTKGLGDENLLKCSVVAISNTEILDLNLNQNDFVWIQFENLTNYSKFNISSESNLDLILEEHSNFLFDNNPISKSDDEGNGLNFSLNFICNSNESYAFKVYSYKKNCSGPFKVKLVETNSFILNGYEKYDKQKHIKYVNGNIIYEDHIVRVGSGTITNCIYCNERLDLRIHGPFMTEGALMLNLNRVLYDKTLDKRWYL